MQACLQDVLIIYAVRFFYFILLIVCLLVYCFTTGVLLQSDVQNRDTTFGALLFKVMKRL